MHGNVHVRVRVHGHGHGHGRVRVCGRMRVHGHGRRLAVTVTITGAFKGGAAGLRPAAPPPAARAGRYSTTRKISRRPSRTSGTKRAYHAFHSGVSIPFRDRSSNWARDSYSASSTSV